MHEHCFRLVVRVMGGCHKTSAGLMSRLKEAFIAPDPPGFLQTHAFFLREAPDIFPENKKRNLQLRAKRNAEGFIFP